MRSARLLPCRTVLLALVLACAAPRAHAQVPNETETPAPVPLTWNLPQQVEQRLAMSRSLAGTRVRVEGEKPPLTLTGVVGTQEQRERALWIASRAGGGKVRDRLRVDPALAAPPMRPDDDVEKDVAAAILAKLLPAATASESWLQGWRVKGERWEIDVEVDEGDVTLTGTALLPQHVHQAILTARDVPGVRSVHSEVEVVPNPSPEDPVHS
jgi:hypothetical protein